MVTTLRPARADDATFIAEMVAEAVSWDRPAGSAPPAVADIREEPRVADYFDDWQRAGDDGFVAEVDGRPVGACWYRWFTGDRPGYGFLGEEVPGLGLAVRDGFRGQGIGTSLLGATIDLARESGAAALSLSVADGNGARRLYERAGFRPLELDEGGSWTMRLTLDSAREATAPDPRLQIRDATAPDPLLRIRNAHEGDVNAIVGLMEEMAAFFGERTTATPGSVLAMLHDETCGVLVAELDDEIVGVVAWYLYRSLFSARLSAVIEDISVAAPHRDEGVGRALLREAIGRIQHKDVTQTLIAAAFQNERAKHLYRSLGFVDDDLLMLLSAEKGGPGTATKEQA